MSSLVNTLPNTTQWYRPLPLRGSCFHYRIIQRHKQRHMLTKSKNKTNDTTNGQEVVPQNSL